MAEILSENQVNSIIKSLSDCIETKSGIGFKIPDINAPGLGNFLLVVIRIIEKGITTTFEPFATLIELVKNYNPIIPSNIPTFLDKIKDLIAKIVEMVKNPVEFIINLLLEPVIKNFTIPLIINFKMFGLPDFEFKIESEKFKDLEKEKREQIKEYISNTKEFIEQLAKFIILPIKIMIEFFISAVEMLAKIVTDTVNAALDLFTKFTSVDGIISIITDFFKTAIMKISIKIPDILGFTINKIDELINGITEYLDTIFSLKLPDIKAINIKYPEFSKISGLIVMLGCIVTWIINLIPVLPKLLFGL